jgi:hypothetical protein
MALVMPPETAPNNVWAMRLDENKPDSVTSITS